MFTWDEKEILEEVQEILEEQRDPVDVGNLTVGTWVSDKDSHFHITVGRVNPRTGFQKTVAIPHEMVPTLIADMVSHLSGFRIAVANVKKGG